MMTFAEFVGWAVIVLVATFSIVEITYRLVVWGSLRPGLYRDLWCAARAVSAQRRLDRAAREGEEASRYTLSCGDCGGPLVSDERGITCPVPTCKSNWGTGLDAGDES